MVCITDRKWGKSESSMGEKKKKNYLPAGTKEIKILRWHPN